MFLCACSLWDDEHDEHTHAATPASAEQLEDAKQRRASHGLPKISTGSPAAWQSIMTARHPPQRSPDLQAWLDTGKGTHSRWRRGDN